MSQEQIAGPLAVARRRPTDTASGAEQPVVTHASTPRTQVAPSLAGARQALSQARRQRAEYLIALAEGMVSVGDVIEAACEESGKPLRRISLRQLCLNQPGWGRRRTDALLSALAGRIGTTEDLGNKSIAWLIDPRCGGRRYLAWLDVQKEKNDAPWTGFPFAMRNGGRDR